MALPVSLSPSALLAPSRYVRSGSRCAEDIPLDGKATDELVRALLTALSSNLMIACNPGASPVRIPAPLQRTEEHTDTVVLVGASNLRRCNPVFNALGHKTVNITSVGWDGSEAAMGRVRAAIAEHGNLNGATFVLDLFTCTSYHFIQADGGSCAANQDWHKISPTRGPRNL